MIEALVAHFEKHGYSVKVRPGVLHVRKVVSGETLGIDWAISQIEMKQGYYEGLLYRADEYIAMLKQAEQEKTSGKA